MFIVCFVSPILALSFLNYQFNVNSLTSVIFKATQTFTAVSIKLTDPVYSEMFFRVFLSSEKRKAGIIARSFFG
jgi:hypothetical protein